MRTRLLATTLALAGCMSSTGPVLADYPVYRVVNVDDHDTLNVRATANPVSAILAELPPHAEMVEVLEEEDGWGRIIVDGVEGWVSLAYLTPMDRPAAGETSAPGGLICSGTEPFWGLTIGTDGGAEFYDAYSLGEERAVRITEGRVATGRFYPFAYRLDGEVEGLAIIDRRECSDGMSDLGYGWRAYVDVRDGEGGARLLEGCCRTPVRH